METTKIQFRMLKSTVEGRGRLFLQCCKKDKNTNQIIMTVYSQNKSIKTELPIWWIRKFLHSLQQRITQSSMNHSRTFYSTPELIINKNVFGIYTLNVQMSHPVNNQILIWVSVLNESLKIDLIEETFSITNKTKTEDGIPTFSRAYQFHQWLQFAHNASCKDNKIESDVNYWGTDKCPLVQYVRYEKHFNQRGLV